MSVLQLAHLKVAQPKLGAFRPWIYHWFWYPIQHECQTAQQRPGKYICIYIYVSIFSFKHVWSNRTDTLCLPILSLILTKNNFILHKEKKSKNSKFSKWGFKKLEFCLFYSTKINKPSLNKINFKYSTNILKCLWHISQLFLPPQVSYFQ